MPTKRSKQANNKKIKGRSKKAPAVNVLVSAPPAFTTPATTLIHKDDDIELAFTWIEKDGSISAARLAKRLPHTAQSLRDGEVQFDAVAKELFNRVMDRSTARTRQRGGRQLLRNFNGNKAILSNIAFGISNACLPPPLDSDETFFYEVTVGVYWTLRRAVLRAAENDASWKAMERIALTQVVKQTVDEAFASWEKRLDDKLYPGRPDGTFWQGCDFLKSSLEAFDKFLIDGFYEKLVSDATQEEIYQRLVWDSTCMHHQLVNGRLNRDLELAAFAIGSGADEGTKRCWECGASLATANECTGCKAALYCGQKCQLKAWKDGHKNACSNLKVKQEHFFESLQSVDDAHRTGVLEGMRLCRRFDYDELWLVHSMAAVYNTDHPATQELGERSMKYFYENLARVIRGEWWLFDESGTPSAEEFKQITREVGDTENDASLYFKLVTIFLSHDYVGFARRTGADSQSIKLLFANVFGKLISQFGAPMPADVYLEMYRQEQAEIFSEEYRIKHRRHAKLVNLTHLRENYHKVKKQATAGKIG